MKILVINGVNMKMIGVREPELYGQSDYKSLIKFIKESAKELGVSVECYQSDYEGKIVKKIQSAYNKFDGIVINAAAYSHTSIAILDALKAVKLPTVEVHLTNINEREDFRKFSYVSLYAQKIICGKGFEGYKDALTYFAKNRHKS